MNYKEEIEQAKEQLNHLNEKLQMITASIMAEDAQNLHHGPTPDLSLEKVKESATKSYWGVDWGAVEGGRPEKVIGPDGEELINEPLPLKKRKQIGQWYKSDGVYAIYHGKGVPSYGHDSNRGWLVTAFFTWGVDDWTEATHEEVGRVLITEAKRRYDGKKVKFSEDRYFSNLTDICSFTYEPSRDALRATWGAHAIDLFCRGEWVDVVEEKTLPEIAGYEGRDMVDMLQWGCRCIEKEFLERIHSYGITSLTLDVDGKSVTVSKEQMNQIFEYLNLETDE